MMVKARDFIKFAEFNQYLIELYKNRGKGVTIAELCPQIIEWFEENN
jgi:hypothetical protein